MNRKKDPSLYVLEHTSVEEIHVIKKSVHEHLQYQWELYSELARQRNQISEEIKKALAGSCISDYSFNNWQRVVKYKYGLHPLSTKG